MNKAGRNGLCSGLYLPSRLGSAIQFSQNYTLMNHAAVQLSVKQTEHIILHPNLKSVESRKWSGACGVRLGRLQGGVLCFLAGYLIVRAILRVEEMKKR